MTWVFILRVCFCLLYRIERSLLHQWGKELYKVIWSNIVEVNNLLTVFEDWGGVMAVKSKFCVQINTTEWCDLLRGLTLDP